MTSQTLDTYKDFFSPSALKHILLNWSEREIGLRHPNINEGIVLRDQGQVDIFNGPTKLVLTNNGQIATIASRVGILAGSMNIRVRDITGFTLNGKCFNPEVFSRRVFLSPKTDLRNYSVIGPETFVNPTTFKIELAVPLLNILDELAVFVSPVTPPTRQHAIYENWKGIFEL